MNYEMNKKRKSPVFLYILIIALILFVFGWIVYELSKNILAPKTSTTPTPSSSKSASSTKKSPSPSMTSILSPSVSPSPSVSVLKIPAGETYELSSQADTNGDGNMETLVTTRKPDNKYHAYVLSKDGTTLFDNPDLGMKPLRIALQTYSEKEKYLSWMLVFTEESGSLAFIHWNGTKYEIPKDDLGI